MARSSRLRFVSLSLGALAATALVTTAALVACGNGDDDDAAAGKDSGTTTTGKDSGTTMTGNPGLDGGSPVIDAGPTVLSFKPSNIDLSGVDLSTVGDADITTSCAFTFTGPEDGATSCDPTSFAFAYQTQSDGSSVGVFIAKSIHVEAGVSITSGVGTVNPIVLVSLGDFLVDGVIDMSADDTPGSRSPGGAIFSGSLYNSQGFGDGGGGASSATNAGGGGSFCGTGGKGAAFEDAGSPASGGAVYGTATLIPLVGGSTGGSGGVDQNNMAQPGSGGGALQLVAGTSITISDGGALGAGGGPGAQQFDNQVMPAGGGSGGAVLLEAPTVTIIGTIAVNGGGGGGGQGGQGNGADLSPVFASGGDGTGGDGNGKLPGDAGSGVPATVNGTDGTPQNNGGFPGAGGGGGGRIRINTTSGKATISGVLSPDVTSMCVTQGTLGH
jgi:hypothetical protein